MDDLIKKHLQDILTAIEEIESFFGDKPKLFEDFYSNLCLRRAIERNIEIIGEAMNRILKTDRNIAITNSRKIVDARNYIIHGYDSKQGPENVRSFKVICPFVWNEMSVRLGMNASMFFRP